MCLERPLCWLGVVTLAGMLSVNLSQADDFTWASSPVSANWNTSDANWSGAGSVWTNGANNSAVFGASDTKSITAEAVALANLTFNDSGYTIGGGPLMMYGSSTVGAGFSATLACSVTNSGIWTKMGTGDLTLDPGAETNTFYAFKTAAGTMHVNSGTTLITQVGSNPESGPAFWVSGGTLVVGGGTLKTTGNNYARVSEYGSLLITNSYVDLRNNAELLNGHNQPGITTVADGGILDLQRLRISQNTYDAALTQVNINTGGVIRLYDFNLDASSLRNGTVNFNGGTIVAKASPRDMLGTTDPDWANIVVNVLAGGAIVDNNGCNITIRRPMNGSPADGGLTKKGAGWLDLWGENSFTGGTEVFGGGLGLASDRSLGAVPATPETNLMFQANSSLRALASHDINANRIMYIDPASTVTFDSQSYTQTVHGVFTGEGQSWLTKSGSGTLIIDPGAGRTNSVSSFRIATGNAIIRSGTTLVTTNNLTTIYIGFHIDGGNMLVEGGTIKTTGPGYSDVRGSLTITNGFVDLNSSRELLNAFNAAGTTTVSGSGVLDVNTLRITQSKDPAEGNAVNINTGGVLCLSHFYIDINFSRANGTVNLNGGTLVAKENYANFLGTATSLAGNDNDKWLTNIFVNVRDGGAIIDTDGHDISIKNPLYGTVAADGGLVKKGSGALTLYNTNTYNGVTSVEAGILLCGRDDMLLPENTVLVSSNAVFNLNNKTQTLAGIGGSGTISNNGSLTVTNSIAPGSETEVGTLTLSSTCSLSGTLLVDVTPEGGSDQLYVQGDLDISNLALSVVETSLLARYNRYKVAACSGTLSGTFTSDNLPSPWYVRYSSTHKEASIVYNAGTVIVVR